MPFFAKYINCKTPCNPRSPATSSSTTGLDRWWCPGSPEISLISPAPAPEKEPCQMAWLPPGPLVGTARGGSGGLLPPPAELDPSQLLPGPQGKLRDRRQTSFIIISGLQEELRIQIYQSAHLRIQIYLSAYLFIYLSITQESLICLIAQKCLQGSILWQFFNTSGSCLSLKSHYLLKYISTYPNISTLFCADFVCCLFCLFVFALL